MDLPSWTKKYPDELRAKVSSSGKTELIARKCPLQQHLKQMLRLTLCFALPCPQPIKLLDDAISPSPDQPADRCGYFNSINNLFRS